MVKWLALSSHSKKVLGSIPSQGVSVWSYHVLLLSAWVLSGYFSFFPQSKTCRRGVRLIGHSKVPVDTDGCLSIYVSPAMN